MSERFPKDENKGGCQDSLEQRLIRYPVLRKRLESVLHVMENAEGDVEKADAAEQRFLEELRKMGNEVMHSWADNQESRKAAELEESDTPVKKKGKKKPSTGTHCLEK